MLENFNLQGKVCFAHCATIVVFFWDKMTGWTQVQKVAKYWSLVVSEPARASSQIIKETSNKRSSLVQYTFGQGCTYPRRLIARVTKLFMVARNIFSIITAVFFYIQNCI
jgi:hypothetical protein